MHQKDPMRTGRSRPSSKALAGQSLPEFLIVVPVFLFLLLLIFQLVLIYRAKTTLDYAALEAARTGAVTGARVNEMNKGLARGLTPLYATESGVSGLAEAYAKARADLLINSRISIISPSQQAWDDFAEQQYNGQRALPSDNLAFRDRGIKASGVNVQDANILKIRVQYDYPLIVPFVDLVLRGDSEFVKSDGFWDSANVDMKLPILSGPVMGNYYRIPLESYAIVRMQSPIYSNADLP